jgi:hypothetical protein
VGCEHGEEESVPFCNCLCVRAGVRLGIVVKEVIFHILVGTNSVYVLSQFV